MIRLKFLAPVIFLTVAALATFFLYSPGFTGPLLFDDFHVLTSNKRLLITSLDPVQLIRAMESFIAGGRQLSMLSFSLNLYFLGDSSWWLKCINAIIHCINGFLLYVVARKIITLLSAEQDPNQTTLYFLPAVATALWLISPINLTSVLYISQRMTLLSSFFILAGIWAYISARSYIVQPARRAFYLPLLVGSFTVLGYLCKENGALLPLFIALLEVIVFRFKSNGQVDKTILTLSTIAAAIGTIGLVYVFVTSPGWLFSGFDFREFSLIERVMTQFRALTFYLSQILVPDTGSLSLWHDNFTISTGLLSPMTTVLSALVLIAMLVVAIISYKKSPVFCIGIMWFFVAHAMESTVLPLELVHEHRNYLASFGIILCLTYAILKLASLSRKTGWAMYLTLAVMFVWNAQMLNERAKIWATEYSFAEHGAKTQSDSAFANFHFARILFNRFAAGEEEYGEKSKEAFLKARSLEPDQIVAELALVIASEKGAFDYDPEWMQAAVEKFPTVAFSAPLQATVITFLECLDWGVCVNSKKDAHKLFDLFLESNNARFIGYYSLYYWKIDYQPEESRTCVRAFSKRKRRSILDVLS